MSEDSYRNANDRNPMIPVDSGQNTELIKPQMTQIFTDDRDDCACALHLWPSVSSVVKKLDDT